MSNYKYIEKQLEEVLKHWDKAHAPFSKNQVLVARYKNAYDKLKFLDYDEPILDVGCRFGDSMDYFIKRGFTNVKGVDLIKIAVDEAVSSGFNVVLNDAHDMSIFKDKEFKVVIMLHSLEHCYDPVKVVDNIHRILKDGGLFYIEVPGTEKVGEKILNRDVIKNGKKNEVRFTKDELYDLMDGLFDIIFYRFNKGGKGKGGPRIRCLCEKVV